MKDVSFGQYYPQNSFVHKCDPRSKLLFLIIYIVAIFISKSFYALAGCGVVFLLAVIFSKVPIKSVLKTVKGIIFLLLFWQVLHQLMLLLS